jgi:hypothetical protein
MPTGLVVKIHNFGYILTFNVKNADGTVRDLTGLFVTLYTFTQEESPTMLFSGACSSTAPQALLGICTYQVATGNFDELGTFDAELVMTDTLPPLPPVNLEESTETFTINIIVGHP